MSVSGVSGSSFAGINTQGMNITTMFAMLQLEMGEAKKAEATEMINSMKAQNEKMNSARKALMQARSALNYVETNPSGHKLSHSSVETEKYCTDNNIDMGTKNIDSNKAYSGYMYNKTSWETTIKNLETHIESLGVNTQTMMVQLEDCMGKYNTWSQGASKTISDGNQTLQSIMNR